MNLGKACKNECGTSYCCRVGQFHVPQNELLIYHLRGATLYKLKSTPKCKKLAEKLGSPFIAIIPWVCQSLCKRCGKCCQIPKPGICRAFPDTKEHFIVLPRKCKFADPFAIVIERDLIELTREDVDAFVSMGMKVLR